MTNSGLGGEGECSIKNSWKGGLKLFAHIAHSQVGFGSFFAGGAQSWLGWLHKWQYLRR